MTDKSNNTNHQSYILPFTPCVKCSCADGDFFRLENTQSAGYCSRCFEQVIRHKFAFCLGKNRVFKTERQRDALLIFDPANFASSHLLELIRQATVEADVHKRLRLRIRVLFLSCAKSTDQLSLESDQCLCLASLFPSAWHWHFAHEASIFSSNIGCDLDVEENKSIRSEYDMFIGSCKSDSVRSEIVRLLRTKLICRIACHFRCFTVLLPDNADTLALDILNALCFGRATSLSDLASMVDTRFEPIQFVRPLRDISNRELETMCKLIDSNEKLKFHLAAEGGQFNGALQLLTGQFIDSLRSNGFPATVSTILSVAAKVENENAGQKCSLCLSLFETANESIHQVLNVICKGFCPSCNNLINGIDTRRLDLLERIIQ